MTSVPRRTTREVKSGSGVAVLVELGLVGVVLPLGLEEDHRVVAGDGLLDHPVAVDRVGAGDHLEAGRVRELRLRRLAVVLDRADAATERDPDDHRHLGLALAAEGHLRDLADDLVVRRVDEPVELDLDDRSVAAQRQADRRADDAGLRERRVDDPVLAEVLLQAVGDPEDAAELADVLAHEQDLRVVLHRLAQAHVEALGERDLLRAHARAPSNDLEVGLEAGPLLLELLGQLGVDVVEDRHRRRVGQRLAALAQPGAEVVGLRLHGGRRTRRRPGRCGAGRPRPGRSGP